MKSLSAKLKALRENDSMTQIQLAALLGVQKAAVCLYENNKRKPSYEILIKYSDIFNVSTDYLLGRHMDNTIDVSGLSTNDLILITDLVASLSHRKKNPQKTG